MWLGEIVWWVAKGAAVQEACPNNNNNNNDSNDGDGDGAWISKETGCGELRGVGFAAWDVQGLGHSWMLWRREQVRAQCLCPSIAALPPVWPLALRDKWTHNAQILSALRGTEFVTFPETLYISGWPVEVFQFFHFYSWGFFSQVPVPFLQKVSPWT